MSIFDKIESLFHGIRDWFRKIPQEAVDVLDDIMPLVVKVKEALDSPYAVALTDIIPGIKDDAVRLGLSGALENFIGWYNHISLDDWYIETRAMQEPDVHSRLHKMASSMLSAHTGIKESQADTYAQVYYVSKNK